MGLIRYKDLRKAQHELRSGASDEFPTMTGLDNGRVTIAARLRHLGVDVEGAHRFARKLISQDNHSITVVHGPFWKHQLFVVHAAIEAGIAIGIQVERMRNGRD